MDNISNIIHSLVRKSQEKDAYGIKNFEPLLEQRACYETMPSCKHMIGKDPRYPEVLDTKYLRAFLGVCDGLDRAVKEQLTPTQAYLTRLLFMPYNLLGRW